MRLTCRLFLGFLGFILLFLGYISFFDVHPSSFDIGRIPFLPHGPVSNTESILFYNGAGTFSTIVEGDDWKADQFIHMVVKTGENVYPGVTFFRRGAIPPDAQLEIRWRARGKPGRVLIDVTDGPPPSSPVKQGANFYVNSEIPVEIWSTVTFPLSTFERNPVQPPGAPNNPKLNAEGIQSVSMTFFPESDFTLDVREIGFAWKGRHGFASALMGFILALGFFLWWRMRNYSEKVPGGWFISSNAVTSRLVFLLLALIGSIAVLDPETRLFGGASLLVFGGLIALVLFDDFCRAAWTRSCPWSFRYLAVASCGFYLGFTHNAFILAILLLIALTPAVVFQSRWLLFTTLLAASLALILHPRMNLSSTLIPGALMISAAGVIAVLALQTLMHQRARLEAGYVRSLYRDVFENTSDSIYILNPAGRIEAMNPGFESLVGCGKEEIIARNIRDFVYKEDHPLLDMGQGSSGDSAHRQYDLRFITRQGDIRIGLVRETVVFRGGSSDGWQAIVTDITERKRIEAEREKLVTELKNALAEVKTLSGLLPICAACKKIRDDKGYWSKIESYISAHSEAQFTHSICPECMIELYPDIMKGSGKQSQT